MVIHTLPRSCFVREFDQLSLVESVESRLKRASANVLNLVKKTKRLEKNS